MNEFFSRIGEFIEAMEDFNAWTVCLRLLLATLIGGIIGLERSKKGRSAGMRTHILVCLGAALTALSGVYLTAHGSPGDPARLSAQVISGIGFLGAGTIIVTGRQKIKGLTTAAGLWASACMGLAIGAGFYLGALVGFVLVLITATLLSRLEDKIVSHARNVNIYLEYTVGSDMGRIIERRLLKCA